MRLRDWWILGWRRDSHPLFLPGAHTRQDLEIQDRGAAIEVSTHLIHITEEMGYMLPLWPGLARGGAGSVRGILTLAPCDGPSRPGHAGVRAEAGWEGSRAVR